MLKFYRAYWIILLVAAGIHSWMIFNGGEYWDSWSHYHHLTRNNWSITENPFALQGRPTSGLSLWLFAQLPDLIFTYRLLSFLAICGNGLLIYQLARHSRLVSKNEALALALLSLTYPLMTITFLLAHTAVLASFSFWLGASLLIRSQGRGIKRFLAMGCFGLAFDTNSFFLFYYGFLVYFLWDAWQQSGLSLNRFGSKVIFQFWDLGLFPVGLFLLLRWLFSPISGYNELRFHPDQIWQNLATSLEAILISSQQGWAIYSEQIGLLALSLVLAGFIIWQFPPEKPFKKMTLPLLVYGISLLLLGLLPYAVVGKPPHFQGWDMRHGVLVAVPLSFILVISSRSLIFLRLAWIRPVLFSLCLVGWSATFITSYWAYQGRWAKDLATLDQLTDQTTAEPWNTFWFYDLYWAELYQDKTLTTDAYWAYRSREWTGLLRYQWQDSQLIGIPLTYGQGLLPVSNYQLEPDSPQCQALVVINRNQIDESDAWVGSQYLWKKWFTPSQVSSFLESLITVDFYPIPWVTAATCPHPPNAPFILNPLGNTALMLDMAGFYATLFAPDAPLLDEADHLVLDHMIYESLLPLTSDQQIALTNWRNTKNPADLQAAGIDYLFVPHTWAGYLSEAEYQTITDPTQYELVKEWQDFTRGGYYRLYRIVEH